VSLTYTLVVNGSVYGSQAARNAYQFASALVTQGHTLVSVFFYQDGVTNGSNLADGFSQAGLGSLAEAMLTQDRVVQF